MWRHKLLQEHRSWATNTKKIWLKSGAIEVSEIYYCTSDLEGIY